MKVSWRWPGSLQGRLAQTADIRSAIKSVLGPSTQSRSVKTPLPIAESIRRERSVHVFMAAFHGRVHRYRAKALAPSGDDIGACSEQLSVHPDDVGLD